MVGYPPLVLSFTQAHLCDTPFCNISLLCDTPQKQARKSFAILSLKVSRDMKSIVTGPLRSRCSFKSTPFCWKKRFLNPFVRNTSPVPKVGLPANGGVANRGLRRVWPPFPEIGLFRPVTCFLHFSPFVGFVAEGPESTWKIQKTQEKGLFPQTLKTLTSLNKEVRPVFLGDNLPLVITAFGGPESYFSLAIIAFGAFGFIVPKHQYCLGKWTRGGYGLQGISLDLLKPHLR